MTKRFTMKEGIAQFVDNQTDKTYCEYNLDEVVELLNKLHKEKQSLTNQISVLDDGINDVVNENKQLKSTIAQLIEQNTKNNKLLLSDIRILEKALWCKGCTNNFKRLKELRNEYLGDKK